MESALTMAQTLQVHKCGLHFATRVIHWSGENMANIPKIKLRNSVTECAQSLRKENVGKYHNYGIADCLVSIAATKTQ